MNWTDERVELLRQLWASGLSASQVAAELGGVSRNAVIGKVHRLGLPLRRAEQPMTAAQRAQLLEARRLRKNENEKRRRNGPVALPEFPWRQTPAGPPELTSDVPTQTTGASMDIPVGQRCSILELAEGKCRWPVGDPQKPDFYFCGGKAIDGIPYCGYHDRMAHQSPETRAPRKHWRAA